MQRSVERDSESDEKCGVGEGDRRSTKEKIGGRQRSLTSVFKKQDHLTGASRMGYASVGEPERVAHKGTSCE